LVSERAKESHSSATESTVMAQYWITVRRITLSVALFACLALFVVGFAAISRVFGVGGAVALSLLLAPALVIAVRLWRRWPAVHVRELAFLAVLFCVASGGIVFVVRDWYAKGMDELHAEDMKWTEFQRLLRRDRTFQDVKINLNRKHFYWASGTVASEADLDRLKSLASRCGIEGRIDGPFVHSVSLTVRAPPGG
jgi:hypothetical protein